MYKIKKRIDYLLVGFVIITFIAFLASDSVLGQSDQQNYLNLKGEILNGYSADIELFKYVITSNEWISIYYKRNKVKYNFKLDPQFNYQVFFLSNQGQIKVLHVDAGEKGIWTKEVDIDFDQEHLLHAKIGQSVNKDCYNMIAVSNDYVTKDSKLKKQGNPHRYKNLTCTKSSK